MSRIWAINIGSTTAELGVERTQGDVSHKETLIVEPGEMVELRRSADETLSVPQQRNLLLVTAGSSE